VNQQHFCPGFNTQVIEFTILYDVASPQALKLGLGNPGLQEHFHNL
jgi:hypothetical protein